MSLRLSLPAAGGRPISLAMLGLLLTVLCGVARADIQTYKQKNVPGNRALRNSPPNGVEQTVQVTAGGQVEITLQAHGQEGKSLTFLPREQPAHGTLSELRILSRNTASVTYSQDPSDAAQSDQFSYSVQARGSLVSAPVAVTIQIVPLPPHLVATPAELDFGAVDVGKVSRARVTIENRGGSLAAGQLMPPTPWTVEGSAEYRLGRGEKQTFELIFNPGVGRVFEDEIVLGTQQDQRARLFGTGIGPAIAMKGEPAPRPPLVVGAQSARPVRGGSSAGQWDSGDPAVAPSGQGAPGAARGPTALDLSAGAGGHAVGSTYSVGRDAPVLNETAVGKIERRWNDAHHIKIAWKTPEPAPMSYRVELRYLSIDPDNKRLLIEWRSYAQVDYEMGRAESSATLRGLPAGTRQTMRLVALNARGQASAPSETLAVDLPPVANWLQITPLRVLLVALAVCLILIWRRRSEERKLMNEVSESRAASAAAEAYSS